MSRVKKIELSKRGTTTADVMSLLDILTKAGYICCLRQDECAYLIEYDWEDPEWADMYHYWLNGDEACYIDNERENAEE